MTAEINQLHNSTEMLDLLSFIALSTTVHADAVACAVDDTRHALIQSSCDEEKLTHLEQELALALERQRRVHAAKEIIAVSRTARQRAADAESGGTAAAAIPASRVLAAHQGTYGSGRRARGEKDDEATLAALTIKTAAAVSSESDSNEVPIDVQVANLKRCIRELDAMSARTKLVKLEALKRQVKVVDVGAILDTYLNDFKFADGVEQLFEDSSGEDGNMIDASTVDELVSCACVRMTERYADALGALAHNPLSEDSEAEKIFGCLRYAIELGNSDGGNSATPSWSSDVDSVRTLQGYRSVKHALDEKLAQARQRGRCTASATAPRSAPSMEKESVLSAQEFCGLPTDWPTTAALCDVPASQLLPPAWHILTRRFSFANVAELKALEVLRVDVQRITIDAFLNIFQAAQEATILGGCGMREKAVVAARMAVADCAAPSRAHAWKTVISAAYPDT